MSREAKSSWHKVAAQFIKFNLVGALNTLIDFIIYSLFIWLGTHYLASQVLGYGAGMVNSFVLNSRFTFGASSGERRSRRSISLKFVAWNLAVLLLSLILLAIFGGWLGLHEIVAKLIVTVFTVVINFYGTKRWVFRS